MHTLNPTELKRWEGNYPDLFPDYALTLSAEDAFKAGPRAVPSCACLQGQATVNRRLFVKAAVGRPVCLRQQFSQEWVVEDC